MMDITQIATEYISVVTVLFCYCVGFVIKKWITDVENRWIPTIVAVLGIAINVWVNGNIEPNTVLVGLVSGLASCGVFEFITHLKKSEDNDTVSNDADNKS